MANEMVYQQLSLDLAVVAEKEVDGVEMGVLTDGTPYLTQNGLARLCNVDSGNLVKITDNWQLENLKPREAKIRDLIRQQGEDDTRAFYAVQRKGVINHLYPAHVCMAILEYYAFEASTANDHAQKSYRTLARAGLTHFIYSQVGYQADSKESIVWRQFHDRVSLAYDSVPAGYFSVFKEIATIFVTLINEGASLGEKFLPDISVGQHWGKFWNKESLEVLYGERKQYEHNYPDNFPQAASNPQTPYAYPDDALPEFRKWVREVYLPEKFPTYIENKVKDKSIEAAKALAAIEALKPKQLK